jgi:hypothetical protein
MPCGLPCRKGAKTSVKAALNEVEKLKARPKNIEIKLAFAQARA